MGAPLQVAGQKPRNLSVEIGATVDLKPAEAADDDRIQAVVISAAGGRYKARVVGINEGAVEADGFKGFTLGETLEFAEDKIWSLV